MQGIQRSQVGFLRSFKIIKQFSRDPHATLEQLALLAPVVSLSLHKPVHFVFDADLAVKLLHNDELKRSRDVFTRIQSITGKQGLVQLNGASALELRKYYNGALAAAALEKYGDGIAENARMCAAELSARQPKAFERYTLRNALLLALGTSDVGHVNEIEGLLVELNDICGSKLRALCPYHQLPLLKENKRAKLAIAELKGRLLPQIARARPGSFIHELKNYRDEESFLFDQIMTFLFAGYETTASFVSFLFYEIGRTGAETQNDLARELAELKRQGRFARLPKASLSLARFRRVLRDHPPSYLLAREPGREIVVENIRFAKRSTIFFGVKQIQKNSDVLLAFGSGTRMCPGVTASYYEAATLLHAVFASGNRIRTPSQNVELAGMITSHAKSLSLEIIYERPAA